MQGSWQAAIRNRFKNLRKLKHPSINEPCSAAKVVLPNLVNKCAQDHNTPAMPEGETAEMCMEHIGSMKREMQKITNKNR